VDKPMDCPPGGSAYRRKWTERTSAALNLVKFASNCICLLNLKILTLILFFAFQGVSVEAQKPDHQAVPIIIELFTSEGCSSCPPADAWLEKMDSSQPIPGATVIVLSEHVDYWDHDGWKDPFSSSSMTERQNTYVHEFGLNSAYTPQAIVNGASELHLNDPQEIANVFQRSASATMIPVSIGSLSVEGTTPAVLRAHVEIGSELEKHGGDVYGAIALDRAETRVLRGENGGRQLTHVAVVMEMQKIGKLQKGRDFAFDFQSKLPPALEGHNLRFIVFVQEPGQGKVLGAAMRKPGL
jgi:hypothetical protein